MILISSGFTKNAMVGAALMIALGAPLAASAKDSISLGIPLEPPHLDPTAGAAAAIDEVLYANVFEGLTRIDQAGQVQPALAKAWTVSEDGLVYEFTLHEGVLFHDGSGFDAEDVVFAFERAMAEDSTNAQKGLFEPIDSVTADGADKVVITLKRPTGHFLFNLGWGDAVIVAPESAESNKALPIGTGPFKFDRWVQGDRITLARNPDYWGDAAQLERATFQIVPDPAAAVAAMMAGDIDAFPNFPAPENMSQFEADPRYTVKIGTTEGETILAINNGKPPFDDLKVRQALAHAIDRNAIIDGAMFGYGTPIGSHFAPHHPAYVDLTGMYPHDPEKGEGFAGRGGTGRWPQHHAQTAAAILRPPWRRDHRCPARRGRDHGRDHPGGMGAVAGASVQGQRLRPDHRLSHRADGHRDLQPRQRLLF